jgi:NAD(P)-dependent dehydrogenase (short-subunit alcohol dehydrogenase family)
MKTTREKGVFVTGGCGDIGRAVAARFLEAGARVVLADKVPLARGRAAAADLSIDRAAFVRCDVTDAASVRAAFREALSFLPQLDVAICNAGRVQNEPFLKATEKAWRATHEVNLHGSFLVARRAAQLMVRNRRRAHGRRGTILFTGSWVQEMPWPEGAAYCSSKGGQQMLMRVMAQELAGAGINVNIVAPGIVYAGLSKRIYDADPVFRKRADRTIPMGRLCSADEVAGSFVFLAGDEGAYITGQSIVIDGGATLVRRDV